MKKWILAILVCALIFGGGFALGYYYANSNEPVRSVVESNSVTEVYEEFPVSNLQTIRLNLQNENVRVRLSDNQYVRIVYQPSVDGLTFHYYYDHETLVLTVGAVDPAAGIVPDNREMIYLYLPKNSSKDLRITTTEGFVDIDSVSIGELTVQTSSGVVSITDSNLGKKTSITTDNGSVFFHSNKFREIAFFTKSGNINASHDADTATSELILRGPNLLINDRETGELHISQEGQTKKFYAEAENGVIRLRIPYEFPEPEEPSEQTGTQEPQA